MAETASVLFTDLVGSTELRARLGEDAADELQGVHDALLSQAMSDHGGEVVKGTGDGLLATFAGAADAVAAAVAAQQAAHAHGLEDPDRAFAIRVGISVGDIVRQDGDVHGTTVVEAARLCDQAQGGQILTADLVRALARGRGGHDFESIGTLDLKGLPDPVPACQVRWVPRRTAGQVTGPIPFPSLLSPPSIPYFGRPAFLAELADAGKAALAGDCALDLLVGEPGLGKTRTCSELATAAHEAGAVVLYGRCDEELALPYQPFVEALDHQVSHDPSLDRLGRFAGDLVRLVPDLADRVPDLPAPISSDARAEEHRLFEAVVAWLVAVSRDRGLVLVVDDLHWATRPTLQLLLHAVRGVEAHGDARVWVLATYRDTDVDRAHPLQATLADLRRLPNVRRTSLDPFTIDDTLAFAEWAAGHALDGNARDLITRTHAETDGNPFFAGELLRHFVETGVVRLVDGRWVVEEAAAVDVPEGVRDVLGRRLDRLSENANQILTTAAVLGRDFELDVLADLLAESEDEILDVLDEALRARLVEEIRPEVFRFAHALTRTTLADELSATRRRRLHDRITDALERLRPGDTAMLAHHAVLAGPTGGDVSRPVRHCLAAGEQALVRRAHADAEKRFTQALELLEEDPDVLQRERLQARCGLAEAQRNQGVPDYRDALYAVADDALAGGHVDLAVRATLATYRGMPSLVGAVNQQALDLLGRVLPAIGDAPTRDRALLCAQLASEQVYAVSFEERQANYREAVAIADQLEEDWLRGAVRARGIQAICIPGNAAEVDVESERAVELADRTDDPSLRVLARMARQVGHLGLGRIPEAGAAMREALQIALDLGTPFDEWLCRAVLVQHAAYDGEFDRLVAENQAAFELGQAIGQGDAVNWWGGLWACAQWFLAESDELVPMAETLAGQFPSTGVAWHASAVSHLIELGRLEDARALAERTGLFAEDLDFVPSPVLGSTYAHLTNLAIRMQDVPLATRLLARLEELPEDEWLHYVILSMGPVEFPRSGLLSVLGRHDEAVELGRHGLARARGRMHRVIAAWYAVLFADTLARRGQPGDDVEAHELVADAIRECEAMGLPARAERLRDRLARDDFGVT